MKTSSEIKPNPVSQPNPVLPLQEVPPLQKVPQNKKTSAEPSAPASAAAAAAAAVGTSQAEAEEKKKAEAEAEEKKKAEAEAEAEKKKAEAAAEENTILNKLKKKIDNLDLSYDINENRNPTKILTKTTMIVYDIILFFIILISIATVILNIYNIIKFLYECFVEIGRIQHNNINTGSTFRYKLLKYIIYLSNSNIPEMISAFNKNESSTKEADKGYRRVIDNFFKRENFEDIKKESSTENSSTNESNKEPIFKIFLILKLYFIIIKLYLALFIICIIIFTIFKLISVTSIINNININIDLIVDQKLLYLLIKIAIISFIYVSINLILYKFYFVNKIYKKYYKIYENIIELDLQIRNNCVISNKDTQNSLNELNEKISNYDNNQIEKEICNIINNKKNKDIKEIISIIILYSCITKHIINDNENNMNIKNLKKYLKLIVNNKNEEYEKEIYKSEYITLYSILLNKKRKEPIKYYIFNKELKDIDSKGIKNIITGVNKEIKNINRKISEINIEFEDDNYIINLGWYFLICLIISTIYILLIIIIIYSKYNEILNFKNFIEIKNFDN